MKKLILLAIAIIFLTSIQVLADEKQLTSDELKAIVEYLTIQRQNIVSNARTQISVINSQIQQAQKEIQALEQKNPKTKPANKEDTKR